MPARASTSVLAIGIAAVIYAPVVSAQSLRPVGTLLASGEREAMESALEELGASESRSALRVLEALEDNRLRIATNGELYVEDGARGTLVDPTTGAPARVASSELETPLINNMLRRALKAAIAQQRLRSPDPAVRFGAAETLAKGGAPELADLMRGVLERETDAGVRAQLALALAQIDLESGDRALRLSAVRTIGDLAELSLKPQIELLLGRNEDGSLREADDEVRREAKAALAAIEHKELAVRVARDLFYGISLGSVLLLAALGLAITFGVMGVINMAHGELIMLGAYATFFVQTLFEKHLPDAMDWYLPAAVPVAFLFCAFVGIVLERTVIRFLYGRPLETLLATWGISLVLIQAVRLIFGAANVAVANPSYLSGGWELVPGVVLPFTRIAAVAFSLLIVCFVWYLLTRTSLGLQVRAITQNRRMARCMGIRTPRVDMLTFGLGSGIAGLGGVALSQIGNVGPELGRGYIVDSFMVVVVGGVGKLVGTVVAAFGLGTVNKLLEPMSGAVLGKIFVLGFIILFIQRRPQGLFALQGRAAEG